MRSKLELFIAKTNPQGPISKTMGTRCWLWTASQTSNGYGLFRLNQGTTAHRAAWGLLRGSIPHALDIDHLCRNRLCVNPDHLEPVTHSENLLRGDNKNPNGMGDRKECANGHPFAGANLFVRKDGSRGCRACRRSYQRRSHAA